jgi:hypothetical protein
MGRVWSGCGHTSALASARYRSAGTRTAQGGRPGEAMNEEDSARKQIPHPPGAPDS